MNTRYLPLLRNIGKFQAPLWVRSTAAAIFLAGTALISGCVAGRGDDLDVLFGGENKQIDILLARTPATAAESPLLILSTTNPGDTPTFRPLPATPPVPGAPSGALWASITYPSGTQEVTDSRAFVALPSSQNLWAAPTDAFAQSGVVNASAIASSPVRISAWGTTIYTLGASSILAHNSVTLAPEPSIPLPGPALAFEPDKSGNIWVLRSGSVVKVNAAGAVMLERQIAGPLTVLGVSESGNHVAVASSSRVVLLDGNTLSQTAAVTTTTPVRGILLDGGKAAILAFNDRVSIYLLKGPAFGDVFETENSLSLIEEAGGTALVTNAGPVQPQLSMLTFGTSPFTLYAYNRTDGTVWGWSRGLTGLTKKFQSNPVPNVVSISPKFDIRLDEAPAVSLTVLVTAATAPTGLTVTLNGKSGPAPVSVDVLRTGSVTLEAPATQAGKPGERFQFLRWSNSANLTQTFPAPNGPTTYTATYVTQYQLTLESDTPGCQPPIVTPTGQTGGWYDSGASVILTAPVSQANCSFKAFVGDLDTPAVGTTATLRMDKPRKITASYNSNVGVSHTVTTSPVGLKVNIDGATPAPSPVPVSWVPGSRHTMSGLTTQFDIDLLHQDTEYTFANWSYSGTTTNPLLSPTGPTTNPILVEAPATATTFTANYTVSGYRMKFSLFTELSTQTPSCTATLTPPIPASGFYPANTSVAIQVTPTNGWSFVNYSGTIVPANTNPQITVVMNQPHDIVATCRQPSNAGVTVTTAPAGLQVNVDGVVSTAPVSANWASGTNHTLTAITPQVSANTQYTFANWSPGALPTAIISPTAPASATTYTANYTATGHRMQFAVQATGGGAAAGCTGTLTPPLPASGFYAPGTPVTIQVTAANLWTFVSFSGTIPTNSNQQVTVTMNQPHNIVATCNPPTGAQVSFTSAPITGVPITVDGVAANSPRTAQWSIPSNHTVSAAATVEQAGTRFAFTNWTPTNFPTPAFGVTDFNGTPSSFTANYAATAYQLCVTTQQVGGHTPVTVTRAPAGTDVAGGCSWHGAGTSVTVTVNNTITSLKPTITSGFSTTQGSSATFLMDRPINASVTFALDPAPALTQTIAVTGSGTRTVTVTLRNSGASEILTASPDFTINSDYEILGVTLTSRDYLPGESAVGITAQVRRKTPGVENLTLTVTTNARDILGGFSAFRTVYTDPVGN